jgi:hypothetical protein
MINPKVGDLVSHSNQVRIIDHVTATQVVCGPLRIRKKSLHWDTNLQIWAPNTPHNHKVVFGRIVEGCPRCSELTAGAQPCTDECSRKSTRKLIPSKKASKLFADKYSPPVITLEDYTWLPY